MKILIFGLALSSISLFGANGIKDSVVQIFTTHKEYDYLTPWAPPSTFKTSGSGFIIQGNRIMTNAHVIDNASYIEVRSSSSRDKFEAHVPIVGHDCDLAILELEDSSFFRGKKNLEFNNSLLQQEAEVFVYGFPMGGNELSITKGIVSRSEMTQYAHSGAFLLATQVDAPINGGNSGGPVISDGKVVGVAHQGIDEGQNLGYMIPIPIIQHFMEEVERGIYFGFPSCFFDVQPILNPVMKEFYGISNDDGGLLVIDIPENHFFKDYLSPGDIILKIDGEKLDANGWVRLDEIKISLPFQHLIKMKQFGDMINASILREGRQIEISTPVDSSLKGTYLVREDFDKPPTYYVFGGLVFQPLVDNYLQKFHFHPYIVDLFFDYFRGKVENNRDEIVFLSKVLSDRINEGYQGLAFEVVETVNGHRINNLRDFIDKIENSYDSYIHIVTRDGFEIILDRDEAMSQNPKILNRYFVSYDRSIDLR